MSDNQRDGDEAATHDHDATKTEDEPRPETAETLPACYKLHSMSIETMPSASGGGRVRSVPSFASYLLVPSASAAALSLAFLVLFSSDADPVPDGLHFSNASLEDANSTASAVTNHPSDHAPLLPLQASDAVGFLCAALGLVLAAGGGIGGGGILVPVYILVLGFLPKHAIPLSNVTVFGGAVANTLRNWRGRHPGADRPLIDWDLIVVMEPPTLAGALVGANLNKMLPETAIAVMLVVLLAFTSYGTLKKARRMYQKETEEIKRKNVGSRTMVVDSTTMIPDGKFGDSKEEYLLLHDSLSSDEDIGSQPEDVSPGLQMHESSHHSKPNSHELSLHDIGNRHPSKASLSSDEDVGLEQGDDLPVLSLHDVENGDTLLSLHNGLCSLGSVQHDDDDCGESNSGSNEDLPEFGDLALQHDILEEERHPKRRNVALIVTLFCVVLLVNILKGGGGFHSPLGIECGSAAFWSAQVLLLVWILLVSWLGRSFLLGDAARKAAAGYAYLDDDLRWDARSTVVYPLVSTLAGFCAGMFGIGGGIIKGPLMLAMGIHPAVASATSACMIFFTSFTATTTFSVYGLMVSDYAIVGGLLGFFATLLGQTVMSRLLARYKRNSYIAFCIGFVVLLSAVLMALESVLHLVSSEENEEFGAICSPHLSGYNT